MFLLFISLFCFVFALGDRQNLTAVYLSSVLPQNSAVSNQAVWYDGNDSVYILGGMTSEGTSVSEILKFSIGSDQIEKIGELPEPTSHAKVEADNFGNIYAFVGISTNLVIANKVYKYNPNANTSEIVASYSSFGLTLQPVIRQNSSSNILLIVGDHYYWVKTFDMETHILQDVINIYPAALPVSVGVRFNETRAYFFTGFYGIHNGTIWEMDLATFELREIPGSYVPTTEDPTRSGFSDGEYIYIVSGFHDIDDHPPENHPQDGILKFDPSLGTTTFVPVTNWPTEGGHVFSSSPQCVYVAKLRRMYCFGGFMEKGLDTIFYVDLGQSSTTTESQTASTLELGQSFCVDLPNGLYLHPIDCSSFISCWDGNLYQLFCPKGTFYSPNTQNCGDVNYCDF